MTSQSRTCPRLAVMPFTSGCWGPLESLPPPGWGPWHSPTLGPMGMAPYLPLSLQNVIEHPHAALPASTGHLMGHGLWAPKGRLVPGCWAGNALAHSSAHSPADHGPPQAPEENVRPGSHMCILPELVPGSSFGYSASRCPLSSVSSQPVQEHGAGMGREPRLPGQVCPGHRTVHDTSVTSKTCLRPRLARQGWRWGAALPPSSGCSFPGPWCLTCHQLALHREAQAPSSPLAPHGLYNLLLFLKWGPTKSGQSSLFYTYIYWQLLCARLQVLWANDQ